MNVLAVAYATPFVTADPALLAHTIDAMADKFPAIRKMSHGRPDAYPW